MLATSNAATYILEAERRPQIQLCAPAQFDSNLFTRFIDYTDRKETTVRGYLTCLRQFASWLEQNNITHPTRNHIKLYRDSLERRGLAAGTQHQYLRAVRHFFKWTASEGLYPNIAENIHGAKIRKDIHKRDALAREDVQKILEHINTSNEIGKRLLAMYLLCITCGLRTIELHRANVEDIKTVGEKTYLYVQGKGRDDKDAPVLITPEVKKAISDYLQNRCTKAAPKTPLFVSTNNRNKGGRIAVTTISTILKGLLVSSGYDSDRLTAHSLRHTSGTGAYKATGNIYLAQKHQRHVDPSTTEIYIHAEEREERNTEQQVYNYFFGGKKQGDAKKELSSILETLSESEAETVLDFIKSRK